MLISKVIDSLARGSRFLGKTALTLFGGFMVILILASLVTPLPYVFGVGEALEQLSPEDATHQLEIEVPEERTGLLWYQGLQLDGEWIPADSTRIEAGKTKWVFRNLEAGNYEYVRRYMTHGEVSQSIELPEEEAQSGTALKWKYVRIAASGIEPVQYVISFERDRPGRADTLYMTVFHSDCGSTTNEEFIVYRGKANEMVIERSSGSRLVVDAERFMNAFASITATPREKPGVYALTVDYTPYLYLRMGQKMLDAAHYPGTQSFMDFLSKAGLFSEKTAVVVPEARGDQVNVNNALLEEFFSE